MNQIELIPDLFQARRRGRPSPQEYEKLARVRLSKNFILRDFLFSTESAARGFTNYPEDPDMVIRSGKALCEKILEPILARWGRVWITFAYMSREGIEHGLSEAKRQANPRSSDPHMWDRKSWGDGIYSRIDILPICVEDGEVSKMEFGMWVMMNLDCDLLMQWQRSNVFCITISPKPRRVWIGWGSPKLGEPRQEIFIGSEYWRRIYPTLPKDERPKFALSHTGGSMQWRKT